MLEFLSGISDFITMATSFLLNTLTNFFQVLVLLGSGAGFLIQVTGFMPSVIVVFATLGITIAIVFLIIGR